MVGVHCVTSAGLEVLDVAKPKLTTTVLISLELGYGSIGCLGSIKANNTSSSGAAARFVLDFSLLNFTDRPEQLDQVLVASGPGKLRKSQRALHKISGTGLIQAWRLNSRFARR